MSKTLAIIKPKKNDQTIIGCVSNKCVIILEKVKILIPIPVSSANKKEPLACFQVAFIPSFFNVLINEILIPFIE
mgnify:CR=1 FL=1